MFDVDVETFRHVLAAGIVGTVVEASVLQATIEINVPDVGAAHSLCDIVLEQTTIRLQNLGSFFVQRVLRIWFLKRKLLAGHELILKSLPGRGTGDRRRWS